MAELDAFSKSKASDASAAEDAREGASSETVPGADPAAPPAEPSQTTTEPKAPNTNDPFEGAAKDAMATIINVHAGGNVTVVRSEADFEESKHPRAPDGKFGSGSGGGSGGSGDKGKEKKSEPEGSKEGDKSEPKKELKPKKPKSDSESKSKSGNDNDGESKTATSEKHGEAKVRTRDDLAKELDSVLDGILRSLSSRWKSSTTPIPITVTRGSRVS